MITSSANQQARLPTVAVALIVISVSAPACAQSTDMPIDALKQIYLNCESAATDGDLGTEEVMRCSLAYEELKRRAFGGDFKKLKIWFDAERELAQAVRQQF